MRPDQAAILHSVVGGEMPTPDVDTGPHYVLLYEAANGRGASTGGWALIPVGTAVTGQVHARGQRLMTALGDRSGRANTWIADIRGLDADGCRPERKRAPCPCGSGAQVKHCSHEGDPAVFATAATFIGQREWARRDPVDPLLGNADPGPLAPGSVRVAAGLHTLSAKPLVTSIVDTTEPGGAIAQADDQIEALHRELVDSLPPLRTAEIVIGHSPRDELESSGS